MRTAQLGSTTPGEWQGAVVNNLTKADGSHVQAVDGMVDSMASIRHTNAEYGKQRDTVNSQFAQKIKNTQDLAQMLSSRIHACRATIEHTEWSLQKLRAAHEALSRPIEVCKTRIEMRQKRPKREQVGDSFQEALLREEKELMAAKVRLQEAIVATQRLIKELRAGTVELDADLRDKAHAHKIDLSCVDKSTKDVYLPGKLDKSYARRGEPLRSVLPEILGTPRSDDTPETQGRAQERQRARATVKSVGAGVKLEQAARVRWEENNLTLDQCARQTAMAFRTTQAEMGAKIEHTELLKQELIKRTKLTDQKIAEAHKCHGMTSEKLEFLETPMSASMQRMKIRAQRTPREGIIDEVTEALHNQHHQLQGKRLQLQSKASALQSAVEELDQSRRTLIEDIADKDRSLSIDRGCAAVKNNAHNNYSFGFAKVGQGQRHFADTASSMTRKAPPAGLKHVTY